MLIEDDRAPSPPRALRGARPQAKPEGRRKGGCARTNVIESPFATVRLRQRVTRGAGSRSKALTMAFTLLTMAELRWRRLNGAELLPQVCAGVKFRDGTREERPATARSKTTTTRKTRRIAV